MKNNKGNAKIKGLVIVMN